MTQTQTREFLFFRGEEGVNFYYASLDFVCLWAYNYSIKMFIEISKAFSFSFSFSRGQMEMELAAKKAPHKWNKNNKNVFH